MIPHSRPTLGEEEARAAADAIRSGQVAEGPRVAAFEREMAAYVGRRGAVATSSGLAALQLALLAVGVRAGDAVVVPSYNCAALVQAVRHCAAEVRLCDVDPMTGNPTLETVTAASRGAKAAVITHLFGAAADTKAIAETGILLVEDLAQGLGARIAAGMAGRFGQAAVCSFYATKLMTSGGEGGMVLADEEGFLSLVRDRRAYDERDDLAPRWNYKLTEPQAAVGLVQLSRFEGMIARRRVIAERFTERFAETGLALPTEPSGARHVYHRYVVGLPECWMARHGERAADEAVRALEAKGVAARRPIYKPLHRLMGKAGFPGTEAAWARHLSLPLYPSLTEDEIDMIADAVCSLFKVEA